VVAVKIGLFRFMLRLNTIFLLEESGGYGRFIAGTLVIELEMHMLLQSRVMLIEFVLSPASILPHANVVGSSPLHVRSLFNSSTWHLASSQTRAPRSLIHNLS